MTEEPNVKSLAAKIALIMGEVPTMIKAGENIQQKYKFVTAEDVKTAIRPLLKKHKVGFFASMLDVTRDSYVNKNGTTVITAIAKMCFSLVDSETGERMDCIWFGESNDYADKAVNKSATAATKYFLINTFLLSTSEPEADEETIEAGNPELTNAIQTVKTLVQTAGHLGAKLTVYAPTTVDEAKRVYASNVKELIAFAKAIEGDNLPEKPKGNNADAWLNYIAQAQGN